MNRKATLIVSGLLICCLNTPLTAYASSFSAAGKDTAVSAQQYAHKKHDKKKHKLDVDALVKDNVISKESGDKMKAYLKAHAKERKAEHEKIRKMTAEERQAYFKEKYPAGRPDIWSKMTAEGVITQSEADAIKAALFAKQQGAGKGK